ncbi:MAG: YicC family protein [Desulfovibrio sp.]|nr:YicC family protein [Desulfovibrio sp.]
MPNSMTGYGRCLLENETLAQHWEVKSVNGRHLELKWRLPAAVRSLETRLEKTARRFATRGRVEISLSLRAPVIGVSARLDTEAAQAMLDGLSALARSRGDLFEPDYNALLAVPHLWGHVEEEPDEDVVAHLEAGLTLALEDWNESRAAEGRLLAADLSSRIELLEEWTGLLTERAPEIREDRADALRDRLTEALTPTELDEGRFLQEVAILIDRLDVSEELTRLNAHLTRLRELLRDGTDVGRRMDFTLQECFREINTCGSKLSDINFSRIVVDIKNELEKCREQSQNLE